MLMIQSSLKLPKKPLEIYKFPSAKILCTWLRHFTFKLPLSIQVYKWVSANRGPVTLPWTSIPSRGSRNTPSRFMLQKRNKLRPDEPLGSYVDLTFLYI